MEKTRAEIAIKRIGTMMLAGMLLLGVVLSGISASDTSEDEAIYNEAASTAETLADAEVKTDIIEAEREEDDEDPSPAEEESEPEPEAAASTEPDSEKEEIAPENNKAEMTEKDGIMPVAGGNYTVTNETTGKPIGTSYSSLADAVAACVTTDPCIIEATQDDPDMGTTYVEIPADKDITLTSSATDARTITQQTITYNDPDHGNSHDNSARHFYAHGKLTLKNIVLAGVDGTPFYEDNGGVYVAPGGNFHMGTGAVIEQCAYYYGGSVYVESATFMMSGGKIIDNKAKDGNIYVEDGTVTMSGGEISGNEVEFFGGGICLEGGTLTMTGGTIIDNEAAYGGGVFARGGSSLGSKGTFVINGGKIIGNRAGTGGGVYAGGIEVKIKAGEICENTGEFEGIFNEFEGGGLYVSGGTFEMTGGKINGNKAKYGGGIMFRGGEVEIKEGEIIGNKAAYGGGVYNEWSQFEMSGGEITDNEAEYEGGGIYTFNCNYNNPVDLTAHSESYMDMTITAPAAVKDNTAAAKNVLPVNHAEFTAFPGTLLNNNEINYCGNCLITFDANNNTDEPVTREATSGTSDAQATLLLESETGFTVPADFSLTEWNTKEDGTGTGYEPGATIPVNDNLTLYAIWKEKIYIVTNDVSKALIGTYTSLADAVAACVTTDPCIIEATKDDPDMGTTYVEIPADKVITLTSSTTPARTITQQTTTYYDPSHLDFYYSARHFYVQGKLTLKNIILAGVDGTPFYEGNGGVYVDPGGIFRMETGAVIEKCAYYYGGSVYVESATFTMTGGKIIDNKAEYGNVYVEDGTVTMSGGEISGNKVDAFGGGIYLEDGTVTMSGGTITDNEAAYGGGVFVSGLGTVGNTVKFVMSSGKIIDNRAGSGGGIYSGGAEVHIDGGEICENTSETEGGGLFFSGGIFEMTDGEISGNKAGYGGGIMFRGGEVEIKEGEIIGNKAAYGGGVYNEWSLFEMSGGEISGNEATSEGGGIYTFNCDYNNPVDLTEHSESYMDMTITAPATVKENTAAAKNVLPVNHAEFTAFPGTLLNNNEINYCGNCLITFDANNNTDEPVTREATSGTSDAQVTLLLESETGFTAPADFYLAEWNEQADGSGTGYEPGATIPVNDNLTLYAIWDPITYQITEEYQLEDGTLVQQPELVIVPLGDDYEKTAPVLEGYRYLGYKIDDEPMQSGATVSIIAVNKPYTVTYIYEEYSEIIHVSVPVKLLWAAYESNDGEVTSPEYYFRNHSSYDISVTLQELKIWKDEGLDLVETAASGADEVELKIDPVTGWQMVSQISLLEGSTGNGLLGKIRAGDQGVFDIIGTYGGYFTGLYLDPETYLQPEYEAVFKFELTH